MFAFFTLSTLALASTVNLTVESEDTSLIGKGISNIHFGAGINGALLSSSPVSYSLSSSDDTVYQSIQVAEGPIPFVFGELFNQLVTEEGAISIPVHIADGYLTINGSDSVFYACNQLDWDPYGYVNADNKGVAIYNPGTAIPEGCEFIKIKVSE